MDMNLERLLLDQQHELTPMVRTFIAQKLYNLLESLEPYIDGTMGPVSTRHLEKYLVALKLLGSCYRVYDRIHTPVQEAPAEQGRDQLAAQVLGHLKALEQRQG